MPARFPSPPGCPDRGRDQMSAGRTAGWIETPPPWPLRGDPMLHCYLSLGYLQPQHHQGEDVPRRCQQGAYQPRRLLRLRSWSGQDKSLSIPTNIRVLRHSHGGAHPGNPVSRAPFSPPRTCCDGAGERQCRRARLRRYRGNVATLDDVARMAAELPEVTEGERFGNRTWYVGGKAFAWDRPFSKAAIRRLGAQSP